MSRSVAIAKWGATSFVAGISRDDVDATNAVKYFTHDLQLARRWSS